MIYLNQDQVKLKSGDIATIIETWGVARTWHKFQLQDGRVIIAMSNEIEKLIERKQGKRR